MLGAGAEVGPLPALLSWGARVIAVDLPRPASGSASWNGPAQRGNASGSRRRGRRPASPAASEEDLAQRAGLDLTADVPAAADWLATFDGPLVLGNYVYADGAANVRLSAAVDALTVRLQAERDDVALAFLATPTDVFAVPADAVAQSAHAYATRRSGQAGRRPLRALSGGRLLRRAYPPGADPGINDSLVRSRVLTMRSQSGCSAGAPPCP